MILGIVPELVGTPTVMAGCRARITRGNRRTHGLENAQVGDRVGVDVGHLHGAVAVSGPEMAVGSHQHAVGSRAVRARRSPTARERPGHASHAPHIDIVFGIENVDPKVRSIGEVIPLGARIDPRNIRTRDRIARHCNHTNETDGGFHVVVMVLVVATVAVVPVFPLFLIATPVGLDHQRQGQRQTGQKGTQFSRVHHTPPPVLRSKRLRRQCLRPTPRHVRGGLGRWG